ncbi:MAG: histidine kinase, partial [Pseudohongiellaceae bacterium]
MTLRLRLTLIITGLLLFSIVAGLSRVVLSARESVAAEVESTLEYSGQLLDVFLGAHQAHIVPEDLPQLIESLLQIDNVRHLQVDVLSTNPMYQHLIKREEVDEIDAPRWFVNLVRPAPLELVRSLGADSGTALVLRTNPNDEIEEIWQDTRTTIQLRLVAIIVFNTLLVYLISRWLKPLDAISEVLKDVQHGDFSRRIPSMSLPELNMLASKMNRLTSVLGASKSENDRLTRKALDIQERERRNMAQELHDALGQSVSAIKAIAVSIEQRTRTSDSGTSASAREIEQIADKAYNSVRILISQLRPSVLDELGLVAALQQMTDDWNDYHEDTFCKLRIDGEFDSLQENQQINIYRIVQEALTNIAKHSKADEVTILLGGKEVISLIISDNGVGYDPGEIEKGMGLVGIRERVQVLRGELTISTMPGEGVSIQIELPRLQSSIRRR